MSQDLGSNSLNSVRDMLERADVAFAAEKYEEAGDLFSGILQKIGYDPNYASDPTKVHCMKGLAECSTHLGDHHNAKDLWNELCAMYERQQPPPGEKYVLALFKYTKACEKLQLHEDAERGYKGLTERASDLLSHAHPLLISIRQNHSSFLRNIDKHHEAKKIEDDLHRLSQEVTNRTMKDNLVGEYFDEHGPLEKSRLQDLRGSKAMNQVRDEVDQRTGDFTKFILVIFVVLSIMVFLVCFGIWKF